MRLVSRASPWAWAAMAALVNPIADFPLNDDWIYAPAARNPLSSMVIFDPGTGDTQSVRAGLLGALFCLPLGFFLHGAANIHAGTGPGRDIGALRHTSPPRQPAPLMALVGAAVLAFNPVWFNVSNGFMTDVPFLSGDPSGDPVPGVLGADRDSPGGDAARACFRVRRGPDQADRLVRPTWIYAIAWPVSHGVRFATLWRGGLPLLLGAVLHVGFQHWLIATGRAPDVSSWTMFMS